MKTMKLWRNILVMCAAMLSLASCSSDDDNFTKQQSLVAHGKRCMTKAWPMLARYSTHFIRRLPITAPLIYSPPTGLQATPPFIASTPSPTPGIC